MSSEFVRYAPEIETIDPEIDETLAQIIDFAEKKGRESRPTESAGRGRPRRAREVIRPVKGRTRDTGGRASRHQTDRQESCPVATGSRSSTLMIAEGTLSRPVTDQENRLATACLCKRLWRAACATKRSCGAGQL